MERQNVESHNPACDGCRTRKLKCSRSRPTCRFCNKHGVSCNYSQPKLRVPLTRAYVSSLEQRIQSLEQMLLAANSQETTNSVSTPGDPPPLSEPTPVSHQSEKGESPVNRIVRPRASTPDSLPAGSNGFDWGTAENRSPAQSNKPNIPSGEEGIGYLGKFTHVALFRTLHEIGYRWQKAPIRQPTCPNHLLLAGEFSDAIPWQALERSDSLEGFADFLIDAYFRHFHTTYPLLHEATFRAQYSEVLPRPPAKAWSLLTRTVFAIGAWCTGCRILTECDGDPTDCFHLFENIDLFRSGSLCMVQALTLLGCYLHKQSKSNAASIYFGAAVKMGMSIGLHREFPDWEISLLDRELRRRAWWCLYVLESGHSMAMGRPVLLPPIGMMDIRPPLNIMEQALTGAARIEPSEVQGLTLYSNLIAQIEFHLMVNETYNNCMSNPDLLAKDLISFNAKIDAWVKSLPQHLQEDSLRSASVPRLNFASHHLLWRVRCLKIIIFFPNFAQLARKKTTPGDMDRDKQEAVGICVGYAHTIVTSIERFFAKEPSNPLRDWYARFCLVQSALVLALALQTKFPFLQESTEMLRSDFDKILILLAKVSDKDPFARTILDVMNQLSAGNVNDSATEIDNMLDTDSLMDMWALQFDEQYESWSWPMT